MQKVVLIVEDEFLIAMDLQTLLERAGWRVLGPAASVKSALRLIEKELPSVAVLDVNLGRELVTPVAEILVEHDVPFAVTSAYENPEEFGGDILAGAPNIGKPIAEHRLHDILERLMAS